MIKILSNVSSVCSNDRKWYHYLAIILTEKWFMTRVSHLDKDGSKRNIQVEYYNMSTLKGNNMSKYLCEMNMPMRMFQ